MKAANKCSLCASHSDVTRLWVRRNRRRQQIVRLVSCREKLEGRTVYRSSADCSPSPAHRAYNSRRIPCKLHRQDKLISWNLTCTHLQCSFVFVGRRTSCPMQEQVGSSGKVVQRNAASKTAITNIHF